MALDFKLTSNFISLLALNFGLAPFRVGSRAEPAVEVSVAVAAVAGGGSEGIGDNEQNRS